MTARSLPDWLAWRAVSHRDHPALITESVCWTFSDLDDRVRATTHRLTQAGVAPGDRVGLLARNTPAFVVAVHAVRRARGVLVPLNIRLTPAELAWQLADADVHLLLYDAANGNNIRAVVALRPSLRCIELAPTGLAGPVPIIRPLPRIALDQVQGIVYTSGTTGRPKGAMLTYGNHWASAVGSALHLGHQRDDRWLALLPLFHVGGLAMLFRSVIGGVPVILHETFDPERTNAAIARERVTLASVVTNMLRRMIDAHGDAPYPPTLRRVLLGGGPAPDQLVAESLRRGVPVAPTYGLTETASQVTTLLPEEVLAHLGAAGRPLPVTEVAVRRNGRAVLPGEVGEIVVRGPTVTRGYVGLSADQPGSWRGGWFATGDLGRLDDEGYLFVIDRRHDLIISGGENIYPAEIEAVIAAHPAIAEVAVVGKPDARWGAAPVAFVVSRTPDRPAETEIADWIASRLAPYKHPRHIVWIDALPRNAAGKVRRDELRKVAQTERPDQG
jgi:O-succinylbenzoic acid--CoA ligase